MQEYIYGLISIIFYIFHWVSQEYITPIFRGNVFFLSIWNKYANDRTKTSFSYLYSHKMFYPRLCCQIIFSLYVWLHGSWCHMLRHGNPEKCMFKYITVYIDTLLRTPKRVFHTLTHKKWFSTWTTVSNQFGGVLENFRYYWSINISFFRIYALIVLDLSFYFGHFSKTGAKRIKTLVTKCVWHPYKNLSKRSVQFIWIYLDPSSYIKSVLGAVKILKDKIQT